MSLNYAEIDLDKPRKLLFRIQDLRDLCLRVGRASGGPAVAMLDLLDKLGKMDLDTVLTALFMGLRHEDKRLTPEKVTDLVQTFVDTQGSMADLLNALNEAIEKSGVIRRREGSNELGESESPR